MRKKFVQQTWQNLQQILRDIARVSENGHLWVDIKCDFFDLRHLHMRCFEKKISSDTCLALPTQLFSDERIFYKNSKHFLEFISFHRRFIWHDGKKLEHSKNTMDGSRIFPQSRELNVTCGRIE